MNFLIRLALTAGAVLLIGQNQWIEGVHISNFKTAIFVAVALGLLNTFIKPILKILTFPITLLTLGLWLLVLNIMIVYAADRLVNGFSVDGPMPALLFSFAMSVVAWLLNALFSGDK